MATNANSTTGVAGAPSVQLPAPLGGNFVLPLIGETTKLPQTEKERIFWAEREHWLTYRAGSGTTVLETALDAHLISPDEVSETSPVPAELQDKTPNDLLTLACHRYSNQVKQWIQRFLARYDLPLEDEEDFFVYVADIEDEWSERTYPCIEVGCHTLTIYSFEDSPPRLERVIEVTMRLLIMLGAPRGAVDDILASECGSFWEALEEMHDEIGGLTKTEAYEQYQHLKQNPDMEFFMEYFMADLEGTSPEEAFEEVWCWLQALERYRRSVKAAIYALKHLQHFDKALSARIAAISIDATEAEKQWLNWLKMARSVIRFFRRTGATNHMPEMEFTESWPIELGHLIDFGGTWVDEVNATIGSMIMEGPEEPRFLLSAESTHAVWQAGYLGAKCLLADTCIQAAIQLNEQLVSEQKT